METICVYDCVITFRYLAGSTEHLSFSVSVSAFTSASAACASPPRQKQQQVEFTAKMIATTCQPVLASESAESPASASLSASASYPNHLLLVLYLLSRHKQHVEMVGAMYLGVRR